MTKDKSAELTGLIESFGYRMFWHFPPLFNEENSFGNQTNVFADTVSFNMVCLPPDADKKFDQFTAVRPG